MSGLFTKVRKFQHYDGTVCKLEDDRFWQVIRITGDWDGRGERPGEQCRYCNLGNWTDADGHPRLGLYQRARQWVGNKTYAWINIGWGAFMVLTFLIGSLVPEPKESLASYVFGGVFALMGLLALGVGLDFLRYNKERKGVPYIEQGV